MPPAFNLTGTWAADDGARYYLRQLSDGSVAWAGLRDTGFHRGIETTNVFMGSVSSDGRTLSGDWADVPRGDTYSSGTLSLEIVQSAPQEPVRLRLLVNGSSGAFDASVWERDSVPFPLPPQDIEQVESRVRRIDSSLDDNNPPGRDFTVMWGTIQDFTPLTWPIGTDVNAYTYSDFLNDGFPILNDGWPPGHDRWDGDLDFDLKPDFSRQEGDFWTHGWVKRRNHRMLKLFDEFDQHFHCEAIMYGREGPADKPAVLLPGWLEQGGNSVLVNGRPLNGNIVPDGSLTFQIGGGRIALAKGDYVRVTGVAARDDGHHHWYGTVIHTASEIHPVYAIDVVQDFRRRPPIAGVNLTGAWGADDIGTYYLRQIGNTLWWLGLSRDQGRTFANVFHGTVTGEVIQGDWIDVPMGKAPVLGNGSLTLNGGSQSTELIKISRGGTFGALTWTKLYDVVPPQVVIE
jgi:hypothetical protein